MLLFHVKSVQDTDWQIAKVARIRQIQTVKDRTLRHTTRIKEACFKYLVAVFYHP